MKTAYFEKPDYDIGDREILCLFNCHSEAEKLPYFLEYYRSMGVDRFFAIDNLSTDESAQFLKAQPDVHYFFADGSHAESNSGVAWTSELTEHYGQGRWCLTVDVDEIVVFPGSDHLTFPDLIAYMEGKGQRALFTVLLDMYGPGPLQETAYAAGQAFLDLCPFFDSGTYRLEATSLFPPVQIYGGPRERTFWERLPGPAMRKTPLVRWGPDVEYLGSTDSLFALPLSDVVGATLHFELFQDFAERIRDVVGHGDQKDLTAYKRYAESPGDVCFLNEHSVRYENTLTLLRHGVMTCPKRFIEFAARRIERRRGPDEQSRFGHAACEALEESLKSSALGLSHLPQLWSILARQYTNPLVPEIAHLCEKIDTLEAKNDRTVNDLKDRSARLLLTKGYNVRLHKENIRLRDKNVELKDKNVELKDKNAKARKWRAKTQEENARLRDELIALKTSFWWRITHPLQGARAFFRRPGVTS